jgi:hypothetical protein
LLRDWSDAPRVVAETMLWIAWAIGLLATFAPRTETLTALRVVAPALLALAIVAAVSGEPTSSESAAAIIATLLAAILASSHAIAIAAANATAYGDEERVPLRVPPALFLAPIPLARALLVAAIVAPPLLLADGRIVLGLVALVVAAPLVFVLTRALHGLARRWAVLVPAGFVVVDPLTLADPVLFLRERVTAMTAVPAGPAPPGTLDLRLGATAGSLALMFDEPAELFRATRRRQSETVRTQGVCIAVVQRDRVLRDAAARRMRVR